MNRIVRLLAITGLGVTAGATIGAGAAQAATTSNQDSTHRVVAQSRAHFDDTEIVGYFNSPLRCERAGRIGELRDRWEDYDCYRVRFGFRRGTWALQVTYDNGHGWWHGGFRPNHHNGPFGGHDGHDGPFGGHDGHDGPFGGHDGHDGPFGGHDGHDGPFGGNDGHDGHDGPFGGHDGQHGPRR